MAKPSRFVYRCAKPGCTARYDSATKLKYPPSHHSVEDHHNDKVYEMELDNE